MYFLLHLLGQLTLILDCSETLFATQGHLFHEQFDLLLLVIADFLGNVPHVSTLVLVQVALCCHHDRASASLILLLLSNAVELGTDDLLYESLHLHELVTL